MRLTVDLIQSSLSYLNPLKERELDLRGHKIPAIENLGVATDHDAIDFTDNDIGALANLPYSPRLQTLLLARNRVNAIQKNVAKQIPNLHTLVLTANHVTELADLEPLKELAKLTHLSLMENPVNRKEHYRSFLIWRLPSLRFLDYQRIKDAEREQAATLFGPSHTEPTPLASKILNIKSRTTATIFDVGSTTEGIGDAGERTGLRVKLTEQEKKRVQKMIREAKDLREITRLEKELREGRIPVGAGGGDEMEM